jgi:hypothetical protein
VVAVANAVADGHITVVPEVLVTGGGGSLDGLAATLMRSLTSGAGANPNGSSHETPPAASATEPGPAAVVTADATGKPEVPPTR